MPTIKINNTSLNFESIRIEHPENENCLLVFLHEALGSIGQWKGFPELLCRSLQLNGLIYERTGHGNSSPLQAPRKEDYLHQYAEEFYAFIRELIPSDKKIILVGHSDGGSIALLYAAKYPKHVHGVVTIAAHVLNEAETIAGVYPAIQAFEEGKLKGLEKYHGEKTTALFYAWANTWTSSFFKHWNIENDIHQLNTPLLAIQGSKDQYGTKTQLELIEKSNKNITTTSWLSGLGHHPHLEDPTLIVQQIQDWHRTNPCSI